MVMGSGKGATSTSSSSSASQNSVMSIPELEKRHRQEMENLTLTTQPFKTLKFFGFSMAQYFQQLVSYLLAKGGWLMLLSVVVAASGVLLVTIDGPHEKHIEELSEYARFGLWWIALGVASSIGLGSLADIFRTSGVGLDIFLGVFLLSSMIFACEVVDFEFLKLKKWITDEGFPYDYLVTYLLPMMSGSFGCCLMFLPVGSGLHTFVLYLGPHIAFFTMKAMQCGRVDLKSAPYDTIQLKRVPSWLDKDCAEFGEPVFQLSHGLRVPLSSILPQVQIEAVLWGLGTALGELPPYFISRAASISGSRMDAMEHLDASSSEDDGFFARPMNSIKRWLLSHSQHLNFFTILVLASVPNPLFDVAGIMCGQFGVPFWKFFMATMIGKAIIKTHIQTIFIISVCNNQLLNWIENEFIWVLGLVPRLAPVVPGLTAKLRAMREKYMAPSAPAPPNPPVKKWDLSLGTVWNTVVWLMLLNFFFKIVNATAQRYLKKQQEEEIAALTSNGAASAHSD